MPKLRDNQVPSYRLHKQSGQAIVTLSGRDIKLGKYGSASSRTEYQRLTSEWLAGGRRHVGRTRSDDITIAELVLAFWQHAKTYYRNGRRRGAGEASNFKPVLRRLRKVYGKTRAAEFGPLALKAFRSQLIRPFTSTDPKTGMTITEPGWSRTYTNRQIKRVCQVFQWGVENDMVEPAVHHKLVAVKSLEAGRCEARETDR